jgi:hypothetical protein
VSVNENGNVERRKTHLVLDGLKVDQLGVVARDEGRERLTVPETILHAREGELTSSQRHDQMWWRVYLEVGGGDAHSFGVLTDPLHQPLLHGAATSGSKPSHLEALEETPHETQDQLQIAVVYIC